MKIILILMLAVLLASCNRYYSVNGIEAVEASGKIYVVLSYAQYLDLEKNIKGIETKENIKENIDKYIYGKQIGRYLKNWNAGGVPYSNNPEYHRKLWGGIYLGGK